MSKLTRRAALTTAAAMAASTVGAGAASAQDKEAEKETRKPRVPATLKKLLEAGEVRQLTTVDGETSGSVTVETDSPGSNTKNRDLAYVVPAGFVRYQCDCSTDHNSGDAAHCGWA